MVNGVRGSRPGTASVVRIWRRSGSTGRSTPTMAARSLDQAPAAHTTVSVAIDPRSVTTSVRLPPLEPIAVTVQPRTRRAPARRAARAYPATTLSGVQWPSVGEYAAASRPLVSMSGESAWASATSIIRLGTPSSFCNATFFSNAATCRGSSSRNR